MKKQTERDLVQAAFQALLRGDIAERDRLMGIVLKAKAVTTTKPTNGFRSVVKDGVEIHIPEEHPN